MELKVEYSIKKGESGYSIIRTIYEEAYLPLKQAIFHFVSVREENAEAKAKELCNYYNSFAEKVVISDGIDFLKEFDAIQDTDDNWTYCKRCGRFDYEDDYGREDFYNTHKQAIKFKHYIAYNCKRSINII